MGLLLNRAKAQTSTTGTGAVTPGSAVSPYQSWAAAGASAGGTYAYLLEDAGSAWELGNGYYNGTTITRPGPGSDPTFSSSTGALLSLSGSATVACVAKASDIGLVPWSSPEASFSPASVADNGLVLLQRSGLGATMSQKAEGVLLKVPATNSGDNNAMVAAAVPSTSSFTLTVQVLPHLGPWGPGTNLRGLAVEDTSGNVLAIGFQDTSGSGSNSEIYSRWGTLAALGSTSATWYMGVAFMGHPVWMRLVVASGSATLYLSSDGANWQSMASQTFSATGIGTPAYVGYLDRFGTGAAQSTISGYDTVFSWVLTTP